MQEQFDKINKRLDAMQELLENIADALIDEDEEGDDDESSDEEEESI